MGRQTAAVALVGVLLPALAVGCGGKKAASSPPTTTASSSASGSSGSSGASFGSARNCAQLASLASKVAQEMAPTGNSKNDISNEVKLFDALANAAPAEIRSDLRTFATAFETFAKTYSGAGITTGQAPSPAQLVKLENAAKAFSAPKVRAAEQHLSAWSQKNCGTRAANP